MTDFHLTDHAVHRYQKRVENIAPGEIFRRLDTEAMRLAIQIGARCVKLPTGQRDVLRGSVVVTITPKGGNYV